MGTFLGMRGARKPSSTSTMDFSVCAIVAACERKHDHEARELGPIIPPACGLNPYLTCAELALLTATLL
jgi:hypothetical protein